MTAMIEGAPLPQENSEHLKQATLEAIARLDPELMDREDSRQLVEMGVDLIGDVTEAYGTPGHPHWYAGTVENRVMAYHNGGEDGHTSSGELGIGVPRATLLIADQVNRAASREVYDPRARAIALYAASAHDRVQNCGRALLPEGQQGQEFGDERISAEMARDGLLGAGIDLKAAQEAYDGVMATAFDPNTKTQNIHYDLLGADSEAPAAQHAVLGQELVAAADLLSLTHIRGPVGAVENIVELLAANASHRVLQEVLQARGVGTDGVADMGQLLDIIGQDEGLRAKFSDLMESQPTFFSGFQFSDRAIRKVTGGPGIDDLFPGRVENTAVLVGFAERMRRGEISPRGIWQEARARAGYEG